MDTILNHQPIRRGLAGLAVAAMLALAACGGGAGSADTAAALRTGDIGLRIVWPEPSGRLIPAASASIKVELLRGGAPIAGASAIIDAPATSARINSVEVGAATVRATAYPEAGAQGTAQATGDVAITIVEGYKEYGTLTMASTIASFAVTPNPAAVITEATATLTATAKNADNQVVLLPTSATWSVDSGADYVSLPNSRASSGYSATVTGKAPGTATVKVAFTEGTGAERSATATVNVADSVAVAISPPTAKLAVGGTQQFTTTVTGTLNKAVTWSVTGTAAGSVTASGLYTAPSAPGTYQVVATSQADATKSATATVTVPTGDISVTVN